LLFGDNGYSKRIKGRFRVVAQLVILFLDVIDPIVLLPHAINEALENECFEYTARLIERAGQAYLAIDQANTLQQLARASAAAATGVAAVFGPSVLPQTQAWAELHRLILVDQQTRALWLGPEAQLVLDVTPDEVRSAAQQLAIRRKSSVMVGQPPQAVAQLFRDIYTHLDTNVVVGTYKSSVRAAGALRSWVTCTWHAPRPSDEVLDARNPPAHLDFDQTLGMLSWRLVHSYGYTWRAVTRMFGPDPAHYLRRIAHVVQSGSPMSSFALVLIVGTGANYEAACSELAAALHAHAVASGAIDVE
jgi:hypothetical protein